jgi:hypothetical protein
MQPATKRLFTVCSVVGLFWLKEVSSIVELGVVLVTLKFVYFRHGWHGDKPRHMRYYMYEHVSLHDCSCKLSKTMTIILPAGVLIP